MLASFAIHTCTQIPISSMCAMIQVVSRWNCRTNIYIFTLQSWLAQFFWCAEQLEKFLTYTQSDLYGNLMWWFPIPFAINWNPRIGRERTKQWEELIITLALNLPYWMQPNCLDLCVSACVCVCENVRMRCWMAEYLRQGAWDMIRIVCVAYAHGWLPYKWPSIYIENYESQMSYVCKPSKRNKTRIDTKYSSEWKWKRNYTHTNSKLHFCALLDNPVQCTSTVKKWYAERAGDRTIQVHNNFFETIVEVNARKYKTCCKIYALLL